MAIGIDRLIYIGELISPRLPYFWRCSARSNVIESISPWLFILELLKPVSKRISLSRRPTI
jgi:hypothetical protein